MGKPVSVKDRVDQAIYEIVAFGGRPKRIVLGQEAYRKLVDELSLHFSYWSEPRCPHCGVSLLKYCDLPVERADDNLVVVE